MAATLQRNRTERSRAASRRPPLGCTGGAHRQRVQAEVMGPWPDSTASDHVLVDKWPAENHDLDFDRRQHARIAGVQGSADGALMR